MKIARDQNSLASVWNYFAQTFVLVVFFVAPKVHSQEGSFTGIHHNYQEARALGMGDAFVAVADDSSALFYNPAGLAWLESGQFVGSLDFGFSSGMLSFNSSLTSAMESSTNPTQQYQAISEFLSSNYGKVYGARAGLFQGVYVRPRWGVAFLPLDLQSEISIINQGVPGGSLRVFADSTIAYGFARKLESVPGRFAWGVTGKFINRGYLAKSFNALDVLVDGSALIKTSDFKDGYTLDFDLGTLWKPEIPTEGFWSSLRWASPTFGLVMRNALDYGFGRTFKLFNKQADPSDPPEKLNRVFDIGSRWEYPKKWILGGRGALDIRDIGHPQWNFRRGLHLGFEFDWTMKSWWKGHYRLGLSQMYPSFGLSMLLGVFRLDLTTYSEDVGSSSSPVENRYYQTKLNLDF